MLIVDIKRIDTVVVICCFVKRFNVDNLVFVIMTQQTLSTVCSDVNQDFFRTYPCYVEKKKSQSETCQN